MTQTALATSDNWNAYWQRDQTQVFTKISWSKRRIMNILRPYLKKGGRALDAGCGSGFFSAFFLREGMDATALDYSKEALDIARELTQGQANYVQMDLVADSLSAQISTKFDLIFSDGLLEHFPASEQRAIIQNWMSVLSPQGVIVTFVPNKFSPWELIRPFYMPGIKEDPFVLSQLVELHELCGLKTLTQGGLNTLPFGCSPDAWMGSKFGMLLYTITKK